MFRLFLTFPAVWCGTAILFSQYYVPETSPPELQVGIKLWFVLGAVSLVGDVFLFLTRKRQVPLSLVHTVTVVCIVCILLGNQMVCAQFGSVSSQTLLNLAILIALYRIFLGFHYGLFVTILGILIYLAFVQMEATGDSR